MITYAYDAAGQLTNAVWTNSVGTNSALSFQYDLAGRLTNEIQNITTAPSHNVGYEYEAAGRRSKLIYPDGTYVTYNYNPNGWLTNIVDGSTSKAIVTYQYDSWGRVTNRTLLRNSTFTVYSYDAADQVTNIWHRQISGGTTNTISQYQYGYDNVGNRTWVKRSNSRGDAFAYDAINQLTNVFYEATNVDTTPALWTNQAGYIYDAAGNPTSVTLTNTGTTSYTANNLNQYTNVAGTTLYYDANGNVTNDGVADLRV